MKKTVNLIEYLEMGGALSKLDLKATKIMFVTKSNGVMIKTINFIESIEVTEESKFLVTLSNGETDSYHGVYIITEVKVKMVLEDKFLK